MIRSDQQTTRILDFRGPCPISDMININLARANDMGIDDKAQLVADLFRSTDPGISPDTGIEAEFTLAAQIQRRDAFTRIMME